MPHVVSVNQHGRTCMLRTLPTPNLRRSWLLSYPPTLSAIQPCGIGSRLCTYEADVCSQVVPSHCRPAFQNFEMMIRLEGSLF